MQIKFVSLMVEAQDDAPDFYTNVVGFRKMADLPMEGYRWLAVTAPDGIAGVELVLEPVQFLPARVYPKALFNAGIPAVAFTTADLAGECGRLKARDVKFRGEPKNLGPIISATFEDTCGNLVHLVQPL